MSHFFAAELFLLLGLGTTLLIQFLFRIKLPVNNTGQANSAEDRKIFYIYLLVSVANLCAGLLVLLSLTQQQEAGRLGWLTVDGFVNLIKLLVLFFSLLVNTFCFLSREMEEEQKIDFFVMVLIFELVLCLLSAATHMVLILSAFVMVALVRSFLSSQNRFKHQGSEMAFRQAIIEGFFFILLLLGTFLLYWSTGSLDFEGMRTFWQHNESQLSVLAGFAFILFFVVSMAENSQFPAHYYSADACESGTAPMAAFIGSLGTLFGIIVAYKILISLFSHSQGDAQSWSGLGDLHWGRWLAIFAGLTMSCCNLISIHQTKIKRLFGYFIAVQVSFILLGFVVMNKSGLATLFFGLISHILSLLGSLLVMMLAFEDSNGKEIHHLKGLFWYSPTLGICLMVFLVSLSGLPIGGGFVSRVYLISSLVKSGQFAIAYISVANTVLSAVIVMRIFRMITEDVRRSSEEIGWSYFTNSRDLNIPQKALLYSMVVPTVCLGVFWDPCFKFISRSLNSILW